MTVLCAVRDPAAGSVLLGSDTLCVSSGIRRHVDGKIALGKGWAIGVCGEWRHVLLARRLLSGACPWSDPEAACEAFRALVVQDGTELVAKDGELPWADLAFLLTDGARLWDCVSSFTPLEVDYAAGGSGEQVALGAMHAARRRGDLPVGQLMAGLEAAIELVSNCGGAPFVAAARPIGR